MGRYLLAHMHATDRLYFVKLKHPSKSNFTGFGIAVGEPRERGDQIGSGRLYYFGYEDNDAHAERRMMVSVNDVSDVEVLRTEHLALTRHLVLAFSYDAPVLTLGRRNSGGKVRVLFLSVQRGGIPGVDDVRATSGGRLTAVRTGHWRSEGPVRYTCPALDAFLGGGNGRAAGAPRSEPTSDGSKPACEAPPLYKMRSGSVDYLVSPLGEGRLQVIVPKGAKVTVEQGGVFIDA